MQENFFAFGAIYTNEEVFIDFWAALYSDNDDSYYNNISKPFTKKRIWELFK
jgi:hypothetical protein